MRFPECLKKLLLQKPKENKEERLRNEAFYLERMMLLYLKEELTLEELNTKLRNNPFFNGKNPRKFSSN
ncbi:MAG: hypothetical protein A2383_03230 [Candidatus Pacebacteria bacterium RIFOXYB1_FULL_39_46]|nr:MAG: hypothetical protein A2182_01275 [Candidatus Pacebacteria bacterium RIFOXYA1_FULL_38_18]OGJ38430.1 MAG: hypothetical protein A2383_03230 [Candidatus Pacebacteria bacterium RIFOXYB1_FULL_39_46]OGJ40291.1 MAG: hypothetical protein A2411_03375 [Candidatus Pacebacteria bacterium RIFOXYC1_FULL_39_21]OGJ40863.1 MAG: hypothetical protein A2582_02110 [Candidatus Pacebacteria bacterium RIFOXYD1_FULL_39_27]